MPFWGSLLLALSYFYFIVLPQLRYLKKMKSESGEGRQSCDQGRAPGLMVSLMAFPVMVIWRLVKYIDRKVAGDDAHVPKTFGVKVIVWFFKVFVFTWLFLLVMIIWEFLS